MKFIIDALSGATGSPSFMRIGCLMVLLAVLVNWCALTIATGVKQPLSWEEVALVLGALGAKALQRPFEKENQSDIPK